MSSDLDLDLLEQMIPDDILRIIFYDFFPLSVGKVEFRSLQEDNQSNAFRYICTELQRFQIVPDSLLKEGSGIFRLQYVSLIRPRIAMDETIHDHYEVRFTDSARKIIYDTMQAYLTPYSFRNCHLPFYRRRTRTTPSQPQPEGLRHRGLLFPQVFWSVTIKNSPIGIVMMDNAVVDHVHTLRGLPFSRFDLEPADPQEQIFEYTALTQKVYGWLE